MICPFRKRVIKKDNVEKLENGKHRVIHVEEEEFCECYGFGVCPYYREYHICRKANEIGTSGSNKSVYADNVHVSEVKIE